MPTDDERREVAAKLKNLAEVTAYIHLVDSNLASLLFDIAFEGVEWDLDDRSPDGLFLNRLANLIDPTVETCEAELTYAERGRGTIKVFECSKCGKSWEQVFADDFTFCPYCGKRVSYAGE